MTDSRKNSTPDPAPDPFPELTDDKAVAILRRVVLQALLDMRLLVRRNMTTAIHPRRSLPNWMTPAEQRLLLAFIPSRTFARLCLNVLNMDPDYVRQNLRSMAIPQQRRRWLRCAATRARRETPRPSAKCV